MIIELGFGYGISALWMKSTEYLAKKHIIIDNHGMPIQNTSIYEHVKKQKNMYLYENGSSQYFLSKYQRSGKKADVVFIDADERFDGFVTDMYFVTKILQPNGHVIIRNSWNPSVLKGIMFFIKNLPYKLPQLHDQELAFIKNTIALGEKYLRRKIRDIDFCILQLVGQDNRPWSHLIPFLYI